MQQVYIDPAKLIREDAFSAGDRHCKGAVSMLKQSKDAQLLGVAEAEQLTGVSRWTWRAWAYSGKIASVKLGRRLLLPSAEVQRIIAEGTRPRLAV
jgi:excisionase family DNA binding protein